MEPISEMAKWFDNPSEYDMEEGMLDGFRAVMQELGTNDPNRVMSIAEEGSNYEMVYGLLNEVKGKQEPKVTDSDGWVQRLYRNGPWVLAAFDDAHQTEYWYAYRLQEG